MDNHVLVVHAHAQIVQAELVARPGESPASFVDVLRCSHHVDYKPAAWLVLVPERIWNAQVPELHRGRFWGWSQEVRYWRRDRRHRDRPVIRFPRATRMLDSDRAPLVVMIVVVDLVLLTVQR